MKTIIKKESIMKICPARMLTFLVLLLFMVVASNAQSTENAFPKLDASVIYEKTLPSVVFITVVTNKGEVFNGSGVVTRNDGIIATNFHVVENAISARVQFKNG